MYRLGSPIMSDREYDELLDEYKSLTSTDEYNLLRDSLHEGSVEHGVKIHHPYIMGSLDKIKNSDAKTLEKFIQTYINSELNISAKVDGISCRISYKKGRLDRAATRGDGYDGVDITDKIKYVKGIPDVLSENTDIEIRGELVILKSDMPDSDTNRRNICAGLINRKDYAISDIQNITFIAYTVLGEKYAKKD